MNATIHPKVIILTMAGRTQVSMIGSALLINSALELHYCTINVKKGVLQEEY